MQKEAEMKAWGNLLRALFRDRRGEVVNYGMVLTLACAVLFGVTKFGASLDDSFRSIGSLLGSVTEGF